MGGRRARGVWLQAEKVVANKQGTTVLLQQSHSHRSQAAVTRIAVPHPEQLSGAPVPLCALPLG